MTKCAQHLDRSRSRFVPHLAAGLLLTLPFAAHAGEAPTDIPSGPLTLRDCIALALQESPLLEASRFDVASATEEVRSARGQALPEINVSGTAELFSGSPTSKFSVINLGDLPVGVAINSNSVDL